MILRSGAALLAALLFATPVIAAPEPHFYDDVPADLARAALAYDEAQLHSDGPALRRLLADDYKLVNGSGQTEGKAQFIAESTDPSFRLLPFTVEAPLHTVWKDGAVLGGRVDNRWIDHGKPGRVTMMFADVWAKRGGRWQVVFTQVTRPPGK